MQEKAENARKCSKYDTRIKTEKIRMVLFTRKFPESKKFLSLILDFQKFLQLFPDFQKFPDYSLN